MASNVIIPNVPSAVNLETVRPKDLADLDPLPPIPQPPQNLPSEDGEPMETPWHRAAMNLLIESLTYHFRDRSDFFVGGNMFLHFSDKKVWDRNFRGPDFFYIRGVDRFRPRDYYATWEEGGRLPNVIIELASPSTIQIDRKVKRELYQDVLRTPEYFIYDPAEKLLEGLRLNQQRYEPITAGEDKRLWSQQLELWLGTWHGEYLGGDKATWLRFFDDKGQLVMRQVEAEQERAEKERQRADTEQKLAEKERQRADTAQKEIERLQRELEALRGGKSSLS